VCIVCCCALLCQVSVCVCVQCVQLYYIQNLTCFDVISGSGALEAYRQGLIQISNSVATNPRYVTTQDALLVCSQPCPLFPSYVPTPISSNASFLGFATLIHSVAPHLFPRTAPSQRPVDNAKVHGFVHQDVLDLGLGSQAKTKKRKSASSTAPAAQPVAASSSQEKKASSSLPEKKKWPATEAQPVAASSSTEKGASSSPPEKKRFQSGPSLPSPTKPPPSNSSASSSIPQPEESVGRNGLHIFLRTVRDAERSGALAKLQEGELNDMSNILLKKLAGNSLREGASAAPMFRMAPLPGASKWVAKQAAPPPSPSSVAAASPSAVHNVPLLLARMRMDDLSAHALRVLARQLLDPSKRNVYDSTPKATLVTWFYLDIVPVGNEDTTVSSHNVPLLIEMDRLDDLDSRQALWHFATQFWGLELMYNATKETMVKALKEKHLNNKSSSGQLN
jgi:hypothetical protein